MLVLQDLSYALRGARQRPGFTLVLITALALGIGLTTAIFSVFYGVLLRPLAFQAPERLVLVMERLPRLTPAPISMPAPQALEFSESKAFSNAAVFISAQRNAGGADRPERVDCLRASSTLLDVLGISLAAGRNFTAEEDRHSVRVALVSQSFAQQRFGSNDVLGQRLLLDGNPYQIIGVLPRGLVFPTNGMDQAGRNADVWLPLSLTPEERTPNDNFSYSLLARLRAGVTLAQAQQAADAIMNRIPSRLPPEVRTMADLHVALLPLREQMVGDSRRLLVLLLGAVGALLLITCLNVSNMLLSRAVGRRREIAVRAAMGASSRRIARQILHENLLLFAAGALLGILCASWFQHLLLRLLPPDLPRTEDIRLDGVVLGFTIAISLLTALVFGLAPALAALRVDLATALQEGSRSQAGGRVVGRTRQFLVAAQIGLAFVLLTSAGLLIRSFTAVLAKQSALRTEHVLTFGVALPETQYAGVASAHRFFQSLTQRLQTTPGLVAIGYGTDIPLENERMRLITPADQTGQGRPLAEYTDVEGEYFRGVGMRLIAGRYLTSADRKGAERVAVVNEAFGRAYWPGENPLDHSFKFGPPQSEMPWVRIVGVVADTSGRDADEVVGPHIYSPFDQEEYAMGMHEARFVLRTRGDALQASSAVRAAVRSLDPSLPVLKLRTMEQVLSESVAPRSANTWLVTVFAIAALLLTALGVHGIVSHSVTERTREIGIRMAVGADRREVALSVFRESARLMLIGLASGVAGSFAASRVIAGLLYGVSAHDAAAMTAAGLALALMTVAATLLPSWRAMHIEPWSALRQE